MNIGERVAVIETELKTIKRLIYVVLGGIALQAGDNFFQIVTASG